MSEGLPMVTKYRLDGGNNYGVYHAPVDPSLPYPLLARVGYLHNDLLPARQRVVPWTFASGIQGR